jgi:acetylornithine deacetylase/succinyl-diaminopimelate desuccinylase-like protein
MTPSVEIEPVLAAAAAYRDRLGRMRERILADTVMIGEIPAPTGAEERLIRFIGDRFTENGLDHISIDEMQNAVAILAGAAGKRNILITAHADKIWDAATDHTVTVTADHLLGPGIADNSLGLAVLTNLPACLELLGITLESNLVFLANTRSLGRGDLAGLRFFLDNAGSPPHAALCVEGVQLGRLSYSSLGMNRGEIVVNTPEEREWESWGLSGAIPALHRIIQRILAIETPDVPRTAIILGSIQAGSAYNVPPNRARLRFELRSEEPGMVARIRDRIGEIVDEVNAEHKVRAVLTVFARRRPGSIGFSHPLVCAARAIMDRLAIDPRIDPSTSELAVLLDRGIPGLTLGLTSGEHKHDAGESIRIDPIFTGIAQLAAIIQTIDLGICDEQN